MRFLIRMELRAFCFASLLCASQSMAFTFIPLTDVLRMIYKFRSKWLATTKQQKYPMSCLAFKSGTN